MSVMSSVGVGRLLTRTGRRRARIGVRGPVLLISSCVAFAGAFAIGRTTDGRGTAQAEAGSTLAIVTGGGVIPVRLESAPPIGIPAVARSRPSSQLTPPVASSPTVPPAPEVSVAPLAPAQPAPSISSAPAKQQPSPSTGSPTSGGGSQHSGGSSTKSGGGTFDSSG